MGKKLEKSLEGRKTINGQLWYLLSRPFPLVTKMFEARFATASTLKKIVRACALRGWLQLAPLPCSALIPSLLPCPVHTCPLPPPCTPGGLYQGACD